MVEPRLESPSDSMPETGSSPTQDPSVFKGLFKQATSYYLQIRLTIPYPKRHTPVFWCLLHFKYNLELVFVSTQPLSPLFPVKSNT